MAYFILMLILALIGAGSAIYQFATAKDAKSKAKALDDILPFAELLLNGDVVNDPKKLADDLIKMHEAGQWNDSLQKTWDDLCESKNNPLPEEYKGLINTVAKLNKK